MLSTFGPTLPSIVKAIPQLAVPVLGAFGLRQVVYETTGSEEVANLATDAMMFVPVLQQVNKAINPSQMDDIIIRTSDEALNFVDDVLDDGVKNTVDNIVDDTANQVTSEASALEGVVKKISIEQYDAIMDAATHNTSAKNVILGKYDGGVATSYITNSGDDYTYLNLGKNWDNIKTQYGYTDQNMFKLFNESFLGDGLNAGKYLNFSHSPIGDTVALGM